MSGVLDDVSATALDRGWLIAAIAPASEYGMRALAQLRPFVPGEESVAVSRATRIARLAKSVDASRLDAVREVFRSAPDAIGSIARASMGDALSDANFLELQRAFDAIVRIDALLQGTGVDACANDAVRELALALDRGRSGKAGFYLSDAFADTLSDLRAALTRAQAEYDAVRGRAAALVARALGRDDVGGDEFIVMRADFDAALPSGVRVIRDAPTYRLCEIDADEPTLAVLERRERAAAAVAHAEEAARLRLSQLVRTHAVALDRAACAFGDLDLLVAAARFTQTYACITARIPEQPTLEFENGRYLPLVDTLERAGRTFTPLSISLSDVAVLTGPNMGGKSVCLRTCGFIALCAAYGLPVPARNAHIALFDDVAWLGIGGGEDRGSLLSSFASEVVRLREILARSSQRRLMLVDEFARTTTPSEGKALLVALLGRLRSLGACALVATHLGGVAEDANVRHFAVRGLRGIPHRGALGDVREALAALALSMDYTIAEVNGAHDQRSDAIALAALLGLDDAFIEASQRAMHR